MPDTGTQIRDYYDEIVIHVTADEILEQAQPITSMPPRRFNGALVAGLAAAIVLLVVGSFGLWLASSPPGIEPVSPSTTRSPQPQTLPDVGLEDVPAFEAIVRYELDGLDGTPQGSSVEVLISYDPPGSFRREILVLDPPDMEFWRGAAGDYVATDGSFPINTGETTEEGEELGPLVWANWEDACITTPVPIETVTTGRTLTTVTCEVPREPLTKPWTIVVDRESGIVLLADTELYGDDFAIPAIRLEVIDLNYEPEFAAGWFGAPEPEAGPVSGDPFVFTFTESLGGRATTVQVTWQDAGTWRSDVISGNLGSLGAGSFQIYADQTLFTYSAGTNEYLEERFPAMEGRRNLVASNCSEDGTCSMDDVEVVCDTTPDGEVAGRPVTRYDCDWPPPYTPSTAWIDDELGYLLKDGDDFEVTVIELSPVIDPDVSIRVCPTADCTLVDSS